MTIDVQFINVTSGYGSNTRQPFVQLNTEKLKEPLQLDPNAARDLAANLLQAAEAAEQDAFMFEFHSALFEGAPEEQTKIGASVLAEYRKWRDAHGQNK